MQKTFDQYNVDGQNIKNEKLIMAINNIEIKYINSNYLIKSIINIFLIILPYFFIKLFSYNNFLFYNIWILILLIIIASAFRLYIEDKKNKEVIEVIKKEHQDIKPIKKNSKNILFSDRDTLIQVIVILLELAGIVMFAYLIMQKTNIYIPFYLFIFYIIIKQISSILDIFSYKNFFNNNHKLYNRFVAIYLSMWFLFMAIIFAMFRLFLPASLI